MISKFLYFFYVVKGILYTRIYLDGIQESGTNNNQHHHQSQKNYHGRILRTPRTK